MPELADIIDIADPADPRLDDFRDLNSVDRRPDLPSGKGLVIAEGVLVVQRMIDRGVDVAVTFRRRTGVTTLTVGMGGVFADEDDALLGVLPASTTDLSMLVGATEVGRQLGRVAGTEYLVEVVASLAALMEAAPEVTALVANPIIAGRHGVSLSDVVIELSEPPQEDLAARRLDLDPEG